MSCVQKNPNQEINQRAVFEGWVIQKIANLQVITLNQQKKSPP